MPEDLGDAQQDAAEVAGLEHLVLVMVDRVQDREVLVLARAARQQEARGGQFVRRRQELLQRVVHLSGVDIFRLEGREDLVVEPRAVAAARRGVLDHLHLGVGLTHAHVLCGG
jgi:hypothetical protein